MPWIRARFGLPLLSRELVQLAARPRTFAIRLAYAIALYGLAIWFYRGWSQRIPADSFESLGKGKEFFEQLVWWQFCTIYLFLPAMTCGTITAEKERQTLVLLKLTRLGSWTILIEKLASRLMEIGTYLMLPLPLAAMAYGLGGIEVEEIWMAVYVLCITAIQVGCIALFFSTWFRTTAGAMLGVYLFGAAGWLYGAALSRWLLIAALQLGLPAWPVPGMDEVRWYWLENAAENPDFRPLAGPWLLGLAQGDPDESQTDLLALMWSAVPDSTDPSSAQLNGISLFFGGGQSFPGDMTNAVFSEVAFASVPIWFSAILFLILARVCLWRYSEPSPARILKRSFSLLDRVYAAVGNIILFRQAGPGKLAVDLPGRNPVAWRERRQWLVGESAHVIRIVLLLELPLFAWLAWQAAIRPLSLTEQLQSIWYVAWIVVLLCVIAISTGIMAGERSRQTLAVLLSTPIPEHQIALEKFAGVGRLIQVLSIPLLTIVAFQICSSWALQRGADWPADGGPHPLWMLWARRIAAIGLYLPMVGWIGYHLGLRLKSQYRSILASLIIVTLICYIPALCEWYLLTAASPELLDLLLGWGALGVINWLDPRFVAIGIENPDWGGVDQIFTSDILPVDWFPFLFHFSIVGGMLWLLRRNALRNFSRLVNRAEVARPIPVRLPFTR